MNRVAKSLSPFLSSRALGGQPQHLSHQQQQQRGISVRVSNGNVEAALIFLGRRMRDSGMESLIKKKAYFDRWLCDRHVKDSTRRYVNRRKIEYRIRNQELFKTLKVLLSKRMSGH